MRFLLLVMSSSVRSAPPDPNHATNVRAAIAEDIQSGLLVATGGLGKRASAAARVSSQAGAVTIDEAPDAAWMAAGGYSLIDVASKEEAIARAKKTLAAIGDGSVELIQVTEMHPRPKSPGV
jgi:hypothetical protein